MSDEKILLLLKKIDKQLDKINLIDGVFADDFNVKETLEQTKNKKKEEIIKNIKLVFLAKPSLLEKCFSCYNPSTHKIVQHIKSRSK